MQRYMKSAMPYRGAASPTIRAICRDAFATYPFASAVQWQQDVLALWRDAEFREERYAAIHLAEHRGARAFRTPDTLPLFEELIVTGAWWDYVDWIASHCVGELLRQNPAELGARMRDWAVGADMWKRRTAILCQLMSKSDTDTALLRDCILPSLDSPEFFLRKAIGWALRQYARTDASWVRNFVREHGDRLSPLSKKEALKHIGASA
jgi:3-methyladenine DNA glycosylase AlkD